MTLLQRSVQLIMRWEWLILLLVLPLLMFPSGGRGLALLAIPLLWVLRWVGFGRFIPRTPFDVALFFFLTTVLISLSAVFDITFSFPKIAGVVVGIGLFYGAVEFARRRKHGMWLLLLLIILVGTGMALVGLVGAEWTGPFTFLNSLGNLATTVTGRPIHIFGAVDGVVNGNELAGVLDWIAPLLIACTIGLWPRLARKNQLLLVLLILATLLSIFTLIATQSRGGIVGLALGILVMAAIASRRYRWLVLLTGVAVLALVLGVLAFRVPGTADPVGDTFGLNGRLEIWSRALFALQDFPLTGLSMNGFRRIVHLLYPLFTISPQLDLAHAHNHLLQAGLDLGLGGLIAYLALWLIAALLLWQSWRLAGGRHRRASSLPVLIIGLSGSLIAGWIFGIMDAISLGSRPGFVWWLLLALVVIVYDKSRAAADDEHSEHYYRRKRKRRRTRPESSPPIATPAAPPEAAETDLDLDIPEFDGYSW